MSHYPPVFQGAYVSPPERGYSGSGEQLWSASSSHTRAGGGVSSAGIRVRIAEDYQLPPLIDFGKYEFVQVRPSPQSFDVEFERQYVAQRGAQQENGSSGAAGPIQVVDPWEERIQHFVEMGHPREAVCVALVTHATSSDANIEAYLRKYGQLINLGFDPFRAAAALSAHQEKLEAAVETCLAEQ